MADNNLMAWPKHKDKWSKRWSSVRRSRDCPSMPSLRKVYNIKKPILKMAYTNHNKIWKLICFHDKMNQIWTNWANYLFIFRDCNEDGIIGFALTWLILSYFDQKKYSLNWAISCIIYCFPLNLVLKNVFFKIQGLFQYDHNLDFWNRFLKCFTPWKLWSHLRNFQTQR